MDANQEISQTIYIEQNNTLYPLDIDSVGDIITFSLDYNSINYTKKIALEEIKDKESKAIFLQYQPEVFLKYLRRISEMNQISLIKKDNIIIIKFEVEMLLEKHEIEIELISKDKNIELIEKELKGLKEEKKELKERIENLETEIKEIKIFLNNNVKSNKSVIMKENEFDFIRKKIEGKLDKEVKELKKLYQATIDGDNPNNFIERCGQIPNILFLIKTAGNRRFGGFLIKSLNTSPNDFQNNDPNTFLFSLDKQKIYPYKTERSLVDNNPNQIIPQDYYNTKINNIQYAVSATYQAMPPVRQKTYNECTYTTNITSFSQEEQNIYPYPTKGSVFYIDSDRIIFGSGEIVLGCHFILNKNLYTNESNQNCCFNYGGYNNALSEDGKGSGIYAKEVEAFQVVFKTFKE